MYDIQTDKQFPNELVVISGLRLSTKLFVFKIQLAWKYSWVDNIKICTETSNTSSSAETKIITQPSKYDCKSEIKMIFLNNNFRNVFLMEFLKWVLQHPGIKVRYFKYPQTAQILGQKTSRTKLQPDLVQVSKNVGRTCQPDKELENDENLPGLHRCWSRTLEIKMTWRHFWNVGDGFHRFL